MSLPNHTCHPQDIRRLQRPKQRTSLRLHGQGHPQIRRQSHRHRRAVPHPQRRQGRVRGRLRTRHRRVDEEPQPPQGRIPQQGGHRHQNHGREERHAQEHSQGLRRQFEEIGHGSHRRVPAPLAGAVLSPIQLGTIPRVRPRDGQVVVLEGTRRTHLLRGPVPRHAGSDRRRQDSGMGTLQRQRLRTRGMHPHGQGPGRHSALLPPGRLLDDRSQERGERRGRGIVAVQRERRVHGVQLPGGRDAHGQVHGSTGGVGQRGEREGDRGDEESAREDGRVRVVEDVVQVPIRGGAGGDQGVRGDCQGGGDVVDGAVVAVESTAIIGDDDARGTYKHGSAGAVVGLFYQEQAVERGCHVGNRQGAHEESIAYLFFGTRWEGLEWGRRDWRDHPVV
mmetsp:Transcript_25571/g.46241  ORF Transcript_25571/g.46241 Transcript_25571/m.46241 type:complete len:392 (-) Transcript_25571:870-2045(-)